LVSVHASDTLALSGSLNRNPFRLWLTIREENKSVFWACRSIVQSYQWYSRVKQRRPGNFMLFCRDPRRYRFIFF
jgi:hypothetical protein